MDRGGVRRLLHAEACVDGAQRGGPAETTTHTIGSLRRRTAQRFARRPNLRLPHPVTQPAVSKVTLPLQRRPYAALRLDELARHAVQSEAFDCCGDNAVATSAKEKVASCRA